MLKYLEQFIVFLSSMQKTLKEKKMMFEIIHNDTKAEILVIFFIDRNFKLF